MACCVRPEGMIFEVGRLQEVGEQHGTFLAAGIVGLLKVKCS